ncbi:MAG: hypothetical protein KGJ37_02865 [Verrucomicrobiota bacterium]|nr:hypothetical protein [Verrucomicrobiota bacterium]
MIAFASDQSKLFGDCEIVTRVAAVSSELKQNKQNWAAGIMMRETLSEGSRFIALACTNGHGVQSFIRSKTDADVTHQEICDCTVPYWLKIARQGDHLLTSKSSDGVIWIQIDDITFKMRHAVWVGLFSTSGGPAQIVVDFEHTGAHAIAAEKSG